MTTGNTEQTPTKSKVARAPKTFAAKLKHAFRGFETRKFPKCYIPVEGSILDGDEHLCVIIHCNDPAELPQFRVLRPYTDNFAGPKKTAFGWVDEGNHIYLANGKRVTCLTATHVVVAWMKLEETINTHDAFKVKLIGHSTFKS